MKSNCCGAEIINPDKYEHGRCSECKENCTSEEQEDAKYAWRIKFD